MNPQNTFEKGPEKIPTRDEVLETVHGLIGERDSTIVFEDPDEQGPILLDVEIKGEKPGETIQYQYMRKGKFPGQPERSKTEILKTYYKDGEVGYSEIVGELD